MSTTRFSEFVRVADAWWAARIEQLDTEGRPTSLSTVEFAELDRAAFDRRVEQELAARDQVQFWSVPPITVPDAKQAVADGKAGFERANRP